MARSWVYRRGGSAGEVSFNVTPLIDCAFQLIIFFILTSQMASESLAKLELARPQGSQAVAVERMLARRVIVNVLSARDDPGSGATEMDRASLYKVDGRPIGVGDLEALVGLLKARKKAFGDGECLVEIRADRRVGFGYVEPVMSAAAEAGIPRLSITALMEPVR
jgi:biopolymer transport protein ExbD